MRDFGLDILKEDTSKSLFNQHNYLTLAPTNEVHHYDVCHKYFEGANLSNTKRLDYSIYVVFLHKNEDSYEWKVDKKGLFFNQKEPSLLVEEVSVYFVNALYPLHVTTNFSGEVIGISNHQEIVARWTKVKQQLIKEYRGELVRKLIKKFEKLINDPLKLEIALSKEIFWSVFFSKRYQKYGKSREKESTLSYPLEAYQTPLNYTGTLRLVSNNIDDHYIQLDYTGVAPLPLSSKWYVDKEKNKLTSDLAIEYRLDRASSLPLTIKVLCDVFDETKKEDIAQIETLVVKNTSIPPKIAVIVEQEEEHKSPKKKKKWFSFRSK